MSDKRKISINTIETACIVAALRDYGMSTLADSIATRYLAADPANDGPETEILARDPYLLFARHFNETHPEAHMTREIAKAHILGEGYGRQ